MKVCIVGGGLCGLVSALELAGAHQVDLFERRPVPGGCLGSYRIGDYWIEEYYHHCFSGDTSLLNLFDTLQVADRLVWLKGTTGYYVDGTIHPLTSPAEILRYPHLTLIEKAEEVYDTEEAEKAAAKLFEGAFTLDDFLDQMQQLKKMGPLGNILGMMPGMPKELKGAQIGDDELKPVEAIIRSMTPYERRKPEIINGSRRNRIATGSGTTVGDVNRLVKQFGEMQKMMKRMGAMGGMGRPGKKGKKGKPGRGFPGLPPGMPGMPGMPGGGLPGMPPGMGSAPGGFPNFN